MKYLIVVPDGAADREIEALSGKTPLYAANMEYTNSLAACGEIGLVKTVPEGMSPGSDAANMSVMGFDPSVFLTGRAPLEAVSIGISMTDTDVAFRTNLITLEGGGAFEDTAIKDHSSGDIPTEEADELIQTANREFADDKMRFYTGVSYRHCLIVKDGDTRYEMTPPHDVLGKRAGDCLPKGRGSEFITDMMKRSYEIFKGHPVNVSRIKRGLNPASSLWIWGQGKKPALSSFYEKYGIKGSVISAVDLIKGIGICAGLDPVGVAGATGTIDTNYEGKAGAAIDEFKKGRDFVYLHVEAPDECSHHGDLAGKIESLKRIDERVVKPVVEYLKAGTDRFRVMILPDHMTPLALRTHTGEPVPFVIYDSSCVAEYDKSRAFTEESGADGKFYDSGFSLADYFFRQI